MTKILPAAQIGKTIAQLYGPAVCDLPNPLVWANYSAFCDTAARRSLLSRNLPRRIDMLPVNLLRYPPGTLVYGDRSYLVVAGGAIVKEQVAPWCVDPMDEAERMRAQPERAVNVAAECLLLARFGENTWGHWVAEMLAKAAIAEKFFPGRFHYAVPWWTTERTGTRGFADAVLESLAAYGILPERLVRMGGFQFFRFAALHDVDGFWQDGLHPGALASLQSLQSPRTGGRKRRKIAVLRRPSEARAVHNTDELHRSLKADGFSIIDLAAQNFASQVRVFREADLVVGNLGSSFTASLFAPPGKKLLSLAPSGWADGYFIRMFQRIHATHADLRGASVLQNGFTPERAPHRVDPQHLAAAIAAISDVDTKDAVVVDGETMPRRLGDMMLDFSFSIGEHSNLQLTGAWSDPEPTHRWSLGERSGVTVARECLPPGDPLWLEIAGQGHVYPQLPTRPLDILVNDKCAGHFDVIGRARYVCRVSADMLAGSGPVRVEFLHPVCPSPRMMGAGSDDRRLGFGFERLIFYKA